MRVVFGLVIVLLIILMSYSAVTYKAPDIQADIDDRTEQAITADRPEGSIEVETDGRHVTLRGYASSDDEKTQFLQTAEDVWGGLGPIDEIVVLGQVSPYRLTATKAADGAIVLDGVAPGEAERDAVLAAAAEAFGPDNVAGTPDLAAGVPAGDWVGAVTTGFESLAALDQGEVEIVDSTINLTGTAPDQPAADNVATFAEGLPEAFAWDAQIDINRPTVTPFTLDAVKSDDGIALTGQAPDEATRDALITAAGEAAGDLPVTGDITLADGMPSAQWPDLALGGIGALGTMETGRFSLADETAELDGTVAPDNLDQFRDLAATLPGVTPAIDLDLDQVSPYRLTATKAADGAVVLDGVAPGEAERNAVFAAATEAFGVDTVSGTPDLAAGVPAGDWVSAVTTGFESLAALDQGEVEIVDSTINLTGTAPDQPTADNIAIIAAGLSEGYDWNDEVSIPTPPGPADESTPQEPQATATDPASDSELDGADETTGTTLSTPTILETCDERTASILASDKITFLTSRAELDADAQDIIEDLAAVARDCLGENRFRLEIGGHTDSNASDTLNQALSDARANAVRDALIEQGVDSDALTAVGYGEREPIADNATSEGRSANRRITFEWLPPVKSEN